MNKKIISAIAILLSLFTACDTVNSERSTYGKATVRVVIDGAQSRTVAPTGALQDVTAWRLFGAKQADSGVETQLAQFSSAVGTTVLLEIGVWRFTLTGYKGDAAILTGTLSGQNINDTETAVLNFTVAPLLEGQGTINLVVELPDGSGITEVRVFEEGELHATLTPSDGKVAFEETHDAGDYYFSICLYKGDVLYGVISEVVHVWANLRSEAAYILTLADLNVTYAITYHLWDEETTTGYYQSTDAAVTLAAAPARPDYVFKGWYETPDLSGDPVSAIPAGSTGDRDFYAKWKAMPPTTSLQAALAWLVSNAAEGDGYTITVNADESLAPTTLSYGDKNVSITLQGDAVERTVSLSSNGSLFTVGAGVTLTLSDNVTLQGRNNNTASLVTVNTGGALVMNAGAKVSGNDNSSSYGGGGVYVSDNSGYGKDAKFSMSGGIISGNTASNGGGGVYVNYGTFTMSGGTINGNSTSSGGGGGGVDVGYGTLTMSGGTISGNIASYGGGVYVAIGTFTLSGGTISGNTTSSAGGGVYVAIGTFTLSGGTINGNTVNSASSGGGVYVSSSGSFIKQSGGIIYGSDASDSLRNATDGNGHAVYVDSSPAKTRNSTAGTGITLDSSVSGSAGGWETTYIVTFDADGGSPATQTQTVNIGGSVGSSNMPTEPTKSGYAFEGWWTQQNGGGSQFTADTTVTADVTVYAKWAVAAVPDNLSLAESLVWISANAVSGEEYTITVNADESLAPTALSYSGKTVSITLDGGVSERTVSLSSNGSLFFVGSGVTLTLGNNVTLRGRIDNTDSLVVVTVGGTLTMENDSKISGNTTIYGGGGVFADGGTFTMNGGEINGNTAVHGDGGGVYADGGTFTMNGGSISGNTTTYRSGGGVFVDGGTFIMNGGTISDNTATHYGGGVNVDSNGTFTMRGGDINDNTASRGGGASVFSGTLSMSSGTISGNTAEYGGGVYVYINETFTKSGGIIYGMDASDYLKNVASSGYGSGYAVYADSKKRDTTVGEGVTLNSAKDGAVGGWVEPLPSGLSLAGSLAWISANAAEGDDYTITLENDEIIAPQELSYGGKNVNITLNGGSAERTVRLGSDGVLFNVGSGVTLTLGNNITLRGRSSNTASLVYIGGTGTFVMENGSKVSNNTTPGYGGGVRVFSGTLSMSGGTISGNTASLGGGVFVGGGTFAMRGGEVSGNTAYYYGGGTYIEGGAFTKQAGGIIYGVDASDDVKNTATNGDSYGHAVYVGSSPTKKRNTTAGSGVMLDSAVSGSAGGWE